MLVKRISCTATLQGSARPTASGSAGNLQIGSANLAISYPAATHFIYTKRLRIFDTSEATLQLLDAVCSVASSYGEPVAQVETATALGTVTTSGNVIVTVTADGLTGSPLAIPVAVVDTDTSATWAGKVRTALAANAAITAMFTVGGSGTSIRLTRIINDAGYANDDTLNITLANGTSAGITPSSSANTTAGSGAYGAIWDIPEGYDAEGLPVPVLSAIDAIQITGVRGEAEFAHGTANFTGLTGIGSLYLVADPTNLPYAGDLVITGLGTTVEVLITVVGTHA